MARRREVVGTLAAALSLPFVGGCLARGGSDSGGSEPPVESRRSPASEDLSVQPVRAGPRPWAGAGLAAEHVRIRNETDETVSIDGTTIRYPHDHEYRLGDQLDVEFTLPPAARVEVYTAETGGVAERLSHPLTYTVGAEHPYGPVLDAPGSVRVYGTDGRLLRELAG